MENQNLAIRSLHGDDLGSMTLDEFSAKLRADTAGK
jgi:threonyl-tRNA synthetase